MLLCHCIVYYRPRTYVRREVMFSQVCVCSTFGGGYPVPGLGRGVPHPRSGQGGTPSQVWLVGVPHPRCGPHLVPPPRPRSGWWGGTQGTPHTWDGVPPYIDLEWGTLPSLPRPGMGTPLPLPHPDLRWGTPLPEMGYPPPITQSSIASTCYAAGGVPLAFTQEDFLVDIYFCSVI